MDLDGASFRSVHAAADCESVEFYSLTHPVRTVLPPHLALIAAVLEHGIDDGDLPWINREDSGVFTFRSCCESLGIDCEAARRVLNRKMKPRQSKKMVRRVDIADVPGIEYTHKYGECPPDGQSLAHCRECRQRYAHWYQAHRRQVRHERREALLHGPSGTREAMEWLEERS